MTPDSFAGRTVLVTGGGVSGLAAAAALTARGARVLLADARPLASTAGEYVGLPAAPPPGTSLVVTSPGWRPDHPLLLAAAAAAIPVIGEVELAWVLSGGRTGPPWLVVTGTNGKTTTVQMLAAILTAAGLDTVAAGNVGLPLVQAALAGHDVLAVELSSFQLHWSPSVRPAAAVVLNVAEDHLDWHGSLAGYAAAKAAVWAGGVAVYNADDAASTRLVAGRPGRHVPVTVGPPPVGGLGVLGGALCDRAFTDDGTPADPGAAPAVLASATDVTVPGPHNVGNALAAAALARAHGVPAPAVAEGLRAVVPGAHRVQVVATVAGVTYVDDSKATNPHAAAASLTAYDRVVWVAGGLLKGASVEDLVAAVAGRLVGVVLLGLDRREIAAAIGRHAPDVPLVEVSSTDDGAMDEVVRAAAGMAAPGDTVLLAPAAASMDMFTDYAARGDAFASAVHALAGR